MSTVVAAVVPDAATGPVEIAAAAAACGHDAVFVAKAGALDDRRKASTTEHGPLVEYDPRDPAPALDRLRELRPAGITTFSEGMLEITTDLAHGLGLPFHSHEVLHLITDKAAQRARLAETGVDRVFSVVVTSRTQVLAALAEYGGPVVVKPVHSMSSQDTHLLRAPADLPADVEPSPGRPFVVEEFLAGSDEGEYGDYLSVESVVDGDSTHLIGVTGKFPLATPFREQGNFFPTHLPVERAKAAAELAVDAARALGVRRGLVHTEIKLTDEGPRVLEVNGRLGGFMAELYERSTGEDLVRLGVLAACGQSVRPSQPEWDAHGRVEFLFWNQPPLTGGTLRGITGGDLVAGETGVRDYVQWIQDGTELPAGVMTTRVDLLRGSTSDHAGMIETVDRCLAHLRLTFDDRVYRASRAGLWPVD